MFPHILENIYLLPDLTITFIEQLAAFWAPRWGKKNKACEVRKILNL